MIQNLEIKAFLMFHNLQLEIIETGGKLDLSPKSHRALMRLFERIGVADVKEATTYEKRLSEQEKSQNRGTLGGYEFTHGVKWVDSKDFQAFLDDYQGMWTLVSNYLNGFNTRWDLNWLGQLRKAAMGEVVYCAIQKKEDFRQEGSDIYPHNDYKFSEFQTGVHSLWHGLNLAWLARSLHESLKWLVIRHCVAMEQKTGLTVLIPKDFELRRCALPGCQKVFVPSYTNRERHRFCSTSHRVLAHRKQEERDRR